MKNKQFNFILIISIYVVGIIVTLTYYFLLLDPMIETLETQEATEYGVIITLIRVLILFLMAIYSFYQWFQQENQYFSDIPFLFGLFFTLVLFGKFFDLFYGLTFFNADYNVFLIAYKSRYLIMVLSLVPMYYLSVGMVLFYISIYKKHTQLKNEIYLKKIQKIITCLIIIIEIGIILIFLDEKTGPLLLSLIVLTSIIVITITFYLVYKNKRLSQVNPKILTLGFGAYLVSQVIRSLLHILIGNNPLTIIIGETIDIFVFLIIFTGLVTKIKY